MPQNLCCNVRGASGPESESDHSLVPYVSIFVFTEETVKVSLVLISLNLLLMSAEKPIVWLRNLSKTSESRGYRFGP